MIAHVRPFFRHSPSADCRPSMYEHRLKHCSIRRNDNNLLISVISNLMYTWVTLAYRWKPRLCLLMISPIGAVYAENNRSGPMQHRSLRYATSDAHFDGSMHHLVDYTHCDRSVIYDRIHASTEPAIP